ncbi:hypothetical protein M2139_001738 [Enterococcus sp. PF1-24]|uniref:hypothetical protein n=1 Tax=unclassified Enterococcus TaxID=2608891 RepID=UPI002473053D|nr:MULTISPECIES: hypothetical protein [unclassified Enterococcus]MDH6364686.1 hypothetical protein [Enterococcus sp. PFB1-1]MDH6401838.1 hypothetical protein [Enterococcus sp. PF1-24]
MSDNLIVALVGLIGTGLGTFGGIFTSTKLIAYRIDLLEKKVEKHNQVMERTFILEEKVNHLQKTLSVRKG